jgi:hypothetical protein
MSEREKVRLISRAREKVRLTLREREKVRLILRASGQLSVAQLSRDSQRRFPNSRCPERTPREGRNRIINRHRRRGARVSGTSRSTTFATEILHTVPNLLQKCKRHRRRGARVSGTSRATTFATDTVPNFR